MRGSCCLAQDGNCSGICLDPADQKAKGPPKRSFKVLLSNYFC
ncbi:hypothetical protein Z950_1412 [Sulfitobacter mediterraneus KCTC 32188]|nr:hypothetical protein Z950_1412 [Sulfitobacter mediterraneus KCTC 32188]